MTNMKKAKNRSEGTSFVNFSNHPSTGWDEAQKNAVYEQFGTKEIFDCAFPAVDSSADEETIKAMARDAVDDIIGYFPKAVMCQGEFGLTYQVVTLLKQKGITVVYSCSERKAVEKKTAAGVVKTSVFSFVKFRKY